MAVSWRGPTQPLPSTSLQRNAVGSRFGVAVAWYLLCSFGVGMGASSHAQSPSVLSLAEHSSQQHEGPSLPTKEILLTMLHAAKLFRLAQHFPF